MSFSSTERFQSGGPPAILLSTVDRFQSGGPTELMELRSMGEAIAPIARVAAIAIYNFLNIVISLLYERNGSQDMELERFVANTGSVQTTTGNLLRLISP